MWEFLIQISNTPFFQVFSAVSIVVLLISWIIGILIWFRGMRRLLPIGTALARRKIAIVGDKSESQNDIKNLLVHSNLFDAANINTIGFTSMSGAEHYDFFIIDWEKCDDIKSNNTEKNYQKIFKARQGKTHVPLIFLTHSNKSIPNGTGGEDDIYGEIIEKDNCYVVNSKGRLLSDVLLAMMTASNQKKPCCH